MIITTPPENTTVCRGSDVTISCGHVTATLLSVTWIINGTSFTQEKIVNSPLYQLNNLISPPTVSLTVFSINGTTTFQCVVLSTPHTSSTHGTVTVTNGMYVNILFHQLYEQSYDHISVTIIKMEIKFNTGIVILSPICRKS